jgi:rhodanese-related sulfurtransferase
MEFSLRLSKIEEKPGGSELKKRAVLWFLIASLLLAGCGGTQTTTLPTTAVQITTTATTTPVATTTSPASTTVKSTTSTTVATTTPPVSTVVTTSAPPNPTVTSTFRYISADDLYALVKVSYDPLTMTTDGNAPYVTIDCRVLESWNAAHIPSAVSIVPNTYNTAVGEEEIKFGLSNLPKGKLLVFWDDFVDLAPALAQRLVDLNKSNNWGYDTGQIRILSGGFSGWTAKSYPTLSAEQ